MVVITSSECIRVSNCMCMMPDMSLRSHNEMMIEEGSQGQEGLSKRSLGSRAGSGASLKGEDDNASGISGLMSKDESGISGLISKDESDVVTKTKDD